MFVYLINTNSLANKNPFYIGRRVAVNLALLNYEIATHLVIRAQFFFAGYGKYFHFDKVFLLGNEGPERKG